MSDETLTPQAPVGSKASALLSSADLLLDAKAVLDRVFVPTPTVVVTPDAAPVKPGYKTSEFWLTSIHTVCALLAASGAIPGFTDPTAKDTALGTAGASIALYIWSRIKAKA